MIITDLKAQHISQAQAILRQNYDAERERVPALPPSAERPDLTWFANNGFGVAALEGERLVGFLGWVPPFENAFRTTDAVGVFSPLGVSGALGDNRGQIYARMYQAAAKKWVKAGALSHAICLYAHDTEAQRAFFNYGFGLRCIDAIRPMEEVAAPPCEEYSLRELATEEYGSILPLNKQLNEHMGGSPTFMVYPHITDDVLRETIQESDARYFVAERNETPCAYIKVSADGENFVGRDTGMMHICGAYCLPEHRGTGLAPSLLNFVIRTLKTEDYTRLGVDFESINPTAAGFWLKYFKPYTHSVVRRIDDFAAAKR